MFVKVYILLTLVHYLFYSKKKELLVVLALGATNSIISTAFKNYDISITFNTYFYIILHTLIWLYIIKKEEAVKKMAIIGMAIYIIFSIVILTECESIDKINDPLAFIVGALLYLVLFLFLCFKKLKKEKLTFFTNNNFILIFSPVLFFIGLSLVFAFENKKLNNTIIWGDISLYFLINCFINTIYYSLINLYIYKQRTKYE